MIRPLPQTSLYFLCALCGLAHVACGQKGPPLAPIVLLPRQVTEFTAKRVEGDIVLQFKLPVENTDGTSPADLDRIEVYAHTGALPTPPDFLKYGTLVHSIPVKQPPPPSEEEPVEEGKEPGAESSQEQRDKSKEQKDKSKETESEDANLIEQGGVTSVRETLTDKHSETGPMPPVRVVAPVAGALPIETLETPGTVNFAMPPARYYTAVGVSDSRNRRGPYAGPIRVPLVEPSAAPGMLEATYTATEVLLSWPGRPEDIAAPAPAQATPATTPAPAAAAPVELSPAEKAGQETAGTYEIYDAVETEETVDAPRGGTASTGKPQPAAAPRFGYNVYEAAAPASAADAAVASTSAPSASASAQGAAADKTADKPSPPVVPLNTTFLTVPSFKDPRVEFGVERCYIVRRVEMVASIPVESAPSPKLCVTPVDTFPPAAPASLAHVSSGTEVSLIWEANTDADLAGYLVLRGEAPGDKLAPLTAAPISAASYVDTSVRRNRSYVYEVVAVDKSGNQSAPSNRVEETIR